MDARYDRAQLRRAARPGPPVVVPGDAFWLTVARAVWTTLILLDLGLFVVGLPALYRRYSDPSSAVRSGIARLGLSVSTYAAYSVVLTIVFDLACFAVAAMIVWRNFRNPIALLVSLMLVNLGAANGSNNDELVRMHPMLEVPARLTIVITFAFLILFPCIFLNGRFVPRWTWVVVLVGTGWLLADVVVVRTPMNEPGPWWGSLLLFAVPGIGVAAQVYRYRRVSTRIERQQTKWVMFGISATILGLLVANVPAALSPSLTRPGVSALVNDVAGTTIITGSTLLFVVSLGIAIRRYRLWDIDVIISRALIYAALTGSVIAIYVLIVGGLGALFQVRGNFGVSLLATGIVAVCFEPLRHRLQRAVNRLLYGERDEPYAVLSRLAERLETALAPEAVLPTVVATVKDALRLPYAAIRLKQQATLDTVASAGQPVADPVRLPLVYQHETVGELLLAPRAPGEEFGSADRRLLSDLARQAGVAAHAVQLAVDLQRSRERLVTAREEERRRLRRDLHDGLGPALAAQTLKVGSARSLLTADPSAADALLASLEDDLDAALFDVRRLVYNLRPPALDELGLLGAIRETAAQYGRQGSAPAPAATDGRLEIEIEAPERLPPLPAAVEVAVYRIAQEALTNVVRHARAYRCRIRLVVADDMLHLQIDDDGVGLPSHHRAGVGLASMRERATELGGSCHIDARPDGPGCTVAASLPLRGMALARPGGGRVGAGDDGSASDEVAVTTWGR